MLLIVFYYLVLPFVLFAIVLRLMRKFSPDSSPREVREFFAADPIEPKSFRAIYKDGQFGQPPVVLEKIGDFEKQEEAVDAAFAAKSRGAHNLQTSSYLVLNDKGEILQEV